MSLLSTDYSICISGYYCQSPGLTEVTAQCSAGYYCPGGQSVPEPAAYFCPQGMFCPIGSPAPLKCAQGFYNDIDTQEVCQSCLARYYCDPTEASAPNDTGIIFPVDCPAGFYCPTGTLTRYQYPCPSGTYSDQGFIESPCKYIQ